ncbi:MAG TPA: alpha/beta fold hydrolase, partial [Clostridia bacterium]|nr:alpha/beta fold hydrolase [Clostridia bacterium]
EFLRHHLPDYMVPSFFVMVQALPLSRNGKVNRQALPPPNLALQRSQENSEPADEIERQLFRLWETTLDVRPISVRDKFFSLGGHSLLAVRLVARIEKTFGKKLPVSAIFEHPTIQQLATLLRDGAKRRRRSTIVEIQPLGSRPPLLLVHGAGSGMFWGYSNLARHIGTEQPIYAFKSRGLDGEQELETIQELAEFYVSELQAFQPHGPYYLGGYCFGGLVAYEMAHRLQAEGESIGFLALINAMPPNSGYSQFRWTPISAWKFARNFFLKSYYSVPLSSERWAALLRWKARLLTQRWKHRNKSDGLEQAQPTVDANQWLDLSEYPEDQRRLWQTHINALTQYRPSLSKVQITLFRSPLHLLYSSFDPRYGWSDFALGGVTLKVVPGAHDTIMEEPRVQRLAQEIRSCLIEAQMRNGDSRR